MHWGRVTHVCVSKIFIIGSDNGLSPGQCQAIIWTNAEILVIGPQGTNFNEILIKIHIFSFKIIHLKMLSGKWQPFRLGLNMLSAWRHQATTWNNHYWSGMIFTSGCLFSAKPLPKSMSTMCQLVLQEPPSVQFHIRYTNFHSTKWPQNIGHFFRPQCVDPFLPFRRPLSGATSAHSGHVPDDYDRILQEISGDFSRMEASVDVSTNPDHFMPDTWY